MAVNAQNQIQNTIWLDVNTRIDLTGKPDLLPDVQAINNSLFNLFSCPVGSRGPIFEPEYGSNLLQLIHDPLDAVTSMKINLYSIQAIQRWEPRVVLDIPNCSVTPNTSTNSFQVIIAYTMYGTSVSGSLSLILNRS